MRIQLSDHFTYKKLFRFTLPSVVMMIFTSVYGVVDGFFVSNFVGKTPFAAVNFIMPFLMILGAVGFMFGTGGSALMGKVTGFVCSQGGVLAVYATQTDPFTAAVAAVNHYNLAGVAAAAAADAPASFKVAFIDELFRATPEAVAGNSIEIQEA